MELERMKTGSQEGAKKLKIVTKKMVRQVEDVEK